MNEGNMPILPTSSESSNFWITGDKLTLRPTVQGLYTFYARARTDSNEKAFKEFSLGVYPCMPSVAVITPSSALAFVQSPYFVSSDPVTSKILMQLNADNV